MCEYGPMHRGLNELKTYLPVILESPDDEGLIEMIVRGPERGTREVVESADLDPQGGLIGDNWIDRLDVGGNPKRHSQLTLMNSRVANAIATRRERWQLAGDQIYVDMNLSVENLPPGSRIRVGAALVEISEVPHTGCRKFAERFGPEALRFANVGVGKENRFRGVNAFVVDGGSVQVGDRITKL